MVTKELRDNVFNQGACFDYLEYLKMIKENPKDYKIYLKFISDNLFKEIQMSKIEKSVSNNYASSKV